MALIKCSECEQMVSDKATACPHCGCPMNTLMACPECGQTFLDGQSYCKNCGCPLDKMNTRLTESKHESSNEYYNNSFGLDKIPNHRKRNVVLMLAALFLLGGMLYYFMLLGI